MVHVILPCKPRLKTALENLCWNNANACSSMLFWVCQNDIFGVPYACPAIGRSRILKKGIQEQWSSLQRWLHPQLLPLSTTGAAVETFLRLQIRQDSPHPNPAFSTAPFPNIVTCPPLSLPVSVYSSGSGRPACFCYCPCHSCPTLARPVGSSYMGSRLGWREQWQWVCGSSLPVAALTLAGNRQEDCAQR